MMASRCAHNGSGGIDLMHALSQHGKTFTKTDGGIAHDSQQWYLPRASVSEGGGEAVGTKKAWRTVISVTSRTALIGRTRNCLLPCLSRYGKTVPMLFESGKCV